MICKDKTMYSIFTSILNLGWRFYQATTVLWNICFILLWYSSKHIQVHFDYCGCNCSIQRSIYVYSPGSWVNMIQAFNAPMTKSKHVPSFWHLLQEYSFSAAAQLSFTATAKQCIKHLYDSCPSFQVHWRKADISIHEDSCILSLQSLSTVIQQH